MKNRDYTVSRNPLRGVRLAACLATAAFAALVLASGTAAQVRPKPSPAPVATPGVRSTPAYAEVLLRKTELSAELESLLIEYTEEFSRVRDIRTELGFLQKEVDRLLAVPPAETGRLSSALGRLMTRKAELETALAKLLVGYKDDHPDVKAAKRRVEMFESAIAEILSK